MQYTPKKRSRSAWESLLRWLIVAAFLFLLVILTPISYFISMPLRESTSPRKSDAIVLFSHGQLDPQWLTMEGSQRLLGALLLYRQGIAPVIVTSGSQHEQEFTQAETEAAWLEMAGIPHENLIVESNSTRTYESVVELRKLMDQRHWKNVAIVTSDLDVLRIRLICRRLGVDASFLGVPVEVAPKPWHLLYTQHGLPVLYHSAYEYAALVLYRWRGWI
jgi:uncharacterized SAM-binding protein YcdF (DUF218 family)